MLLMFSNTSSSASHVKHKFGRKEFARTKPLHSAQAFSITMFACHRVEVHLPLPCPSASRLLHVIVRHLRGSRCAMMLKCIDLCHKSFQYLLSLHQCTHCKRLSPMALSEAFKGMGAVTSDHSLRVSAPWRGTMPSRCIRICKRHPDEWKSPVAQPRYWKWR